MNKMQMDVKLTSLLLYKGEIYINISKDKSFLSNDHSIIFFLLLHI